MGSGRSWLVPQPPDEEVKEGLGAGAPVPSPAPSPSGLRDQEQAGVLPTRSPRGPATTPPQGARADTCQRAAGAASRIGLGRRTRAAASRDSEGADQLLLEVGTSAAISCTSPNPASPPRHRKPLQEFL